MAATQLPPVNTELRATGPVLVFQQAGPGKRWNYSHNEFSVGISSGKLQPIFPGNDRDYQAGDALGHSLGAQVTGTDGLSYLKIECFQWKFRKVALIFNESYRTFHVGYVLLSERDVTWSAITADGATTADALSNLVALFEAEKLPGYLATGIPQPTYSLVTDAQGKPKLYLTFANGYKVEAGAFDALTLAERLSLTALQPANLTTPSAVKSTVNLWAIIAGVGLFGLLGVVILIQVQRRRRRRQN